MLVVVFEEFNGFGKREMRLASGRVDVTTTIKYFAREIIHRTIALRAERHLDLIHILPNENRVFDCANLQRHIHDSFGIARLEIEALKLL